MNNPLIIPQTEVKKPQGYFMKITDIHVVIKGNRLVTLITVTKIII